MRHVNWSLLKHPSFRPLRCACVAMALAAPCTGRAALRLLPLSKLCNAGFEHVQLHDDLGACARPCVAAPMMRAASLMSLGDCRQRPAAWHGMTCAMVLFKWCESWLHYSFYAGGIIMSATWRWALAPTKTYSRSSYRSTLIDRWSMIGS